VICALFAHVKHPGKNKTSAQSKPDMCKLLYLGGDLFDLQSTICWPNNKRIVHVMSSTPSTWNKPDMRDDSSQTALSQHKTVFRDTIKALSYLLLYMSVGWIFYGGAIVDFSR